MRNYNSRQADAKAQKHDPGHGQRLRSPPDIENQINAKRHQHPVYTIYGIDIAADIAYQG